MIPQFHCGPWVQGVVPVMVSQHLMDSAPLNKEAAEKGSVWDHIESFKESVDAMSVSSGESALSSYNSFENLKRKRKSFDISSCSDDEGDSHIDSVSVLGKQRCFMSQHKESSQQCISSDYDDLRIEWSTDSFRWVSRDGTSPQTRFVSFIQIDLLL